MGRFGIGQSVRRVEDRRLLLGSGRYIGDIDLPGQLHAYFLRSPHAHALIRSIDTSAARSLAGVHLVATVDDMTELMPIGTSVDMTDKKGDPFKNPMRYALAKDKVRHVGEPVVMIVADELAQARDASDAVIVDYDPLPAVTEPAAALAPGAPLLFDEVPGNLCYDWEMGDRQKVEAAFQRAKHVAELDLVNNRVVAHPMEPRGCVVEYDRGEDRYTVYVSSQGSHSIQQWLADEILGIPQERIRVVTPDVGGAFGMKGVYYQEYGGCLWASRRLGRPVKWIGDRSESYLSDTQGRDLWTRAALAMDDEGRFLALKVEGLANIGGQLSNFSAYIPTAGAGPMMVGLYDIAAAYVSIKGAMTNTVPVDAYRGAGRPEACYLIERLVDEAARMLKIGRDEIRRRNLIKTTSLPYRTALGETYDSGNFIGLMEAAQNAADWAGFEERREDAAERGMLRGIGLCTYVEVCGSGSEERAELRIERDGSVDLLIGTQSNGQGHATAYAQIISEALGIEIEKVRMIQGDTAQIPFGSGTGGSRSVPTGGNVILVAADKIIKRGKEIASILLEAASGDIEFKDGRFSVVGTDRQVTFDRVAEAAHDPGIVGETAAAGFRESHMMDLAAPTYPSGCHVCELEVDPETGQVRLINYTVADDFGRVINPLLLTGQIEGGIVQGIGQALLEYCHYDPETGQLLTGSLMDYALPRADHVPPIRCEFICTPCTTNPLGIKGAGEAGTIAAPAAVMNALMDALASKGVRHIDMPATPLRIWQAIQSASA